LTNTCSHTVWIKNLNAPQFAVTCPATPVTADATTGRCDAVVAVPAPGITNPCNEAYTVTNDSPYKTSDADASGTYPVGTTTVHWVVTDASGNVTTCTQTVTVTDTQNPVFTVCPANAEDQITNGGCTLVPTTIGRPTVTDNCSIQSLTYTLSGATTASSPATGMNYADGETYNVGVTTVTYTVTDVNGLTNTCSHTVWIKNLNAPQFSAACPDNSSISQDAAQNRCDADVTIPAPVITNPCNEVFSVSYQLDTDPVVAYFTGTGNTLSPVTLTLPVGPHTFTWTVTDASGNVKTCPMTVTVNDLQPTLDCPGDITVQAEFEQPYALNVTVPPPTYADNCPNPELSWELTPPAGYEDQYAAGDLSGTGVYPSPNKFYVGVTTITYTVTDSNGNTETCDFTVTVLAKPDITCPDDISTDTGPGLCTANLNPGVPTLNSGVQPITWTWAITDPGGTQQATGTFVGSALNPGPPDIGAHDFKLGTSVITWQACNVSGCDECTQQIIVEDKEAPTFDAANYTDCVDMLFLAVYSNSVADNLIKNPSPDYATFEAGNTGLDISNLHDNCCGAADMTIHWRIDFTDTPDPANQPGGMLSHPSVSGTGQPSAYGSPIELPGDGVTYTTVVHTITYWVEDCHGNITATQTGTITVSPRPNITKE
jgi:hypothetical protein